jgi:hypothetical protein
MDYHRSIVPSSDSLAHAPEKKPTHSTVDKIVCFVAAGKIEGFH